MPTVRRSARCSRASLRWRACASSRRRAASSGPAQGYLGRWGDFIVGLSYLWEGQALLAEKPAAPDAGARRGRPRPAQPLRLHAGGRCSPRRAGSGTIPTRPATLLANRLDVLERSALPEAVLLGYRTMARIAAAEGAEHRALELLGAMDAVGVDAPPAAPAHRQPGRAGAPARAPVPRPKPAANCARRSMRGWPSRLRRRAGSGAAT